MANSSVTVGPKFTPWAGDDPPPSPLASNPVIFRRHSTDLDERRTPRDSMARPNTASNELGNPDFRISFGAGLDDELILGHTIHSRHGNPRWRDDITALVEFLKNHEPPPGNLMSIPYHDNEKDRGKWSKFRVGKKRSKSMPRSPRQIRLPDSAVSGTTIGGHRHIAISIPLEAMPFRDVPDPRDFADSSENRETAESRAQDTIRTYTDENGVVTVLRQTPGNVPSSLAYKPNALPRPLLRTSSDRQAYGQWSTIQPRSGGQSTNASIRRKRQEYINILPDRIDTPLSNETGSVGWNAANDRQRNFGRHIHAREFQRSAYPSRGSSMAASRRYPPPHPASIDGLISLYGDMNLTPSGYSQKPLPKPPAPKDETPTEITTKQPKPSTTSPSPISERSNERASVKSKGPRVKQIISDHPVVVSGSSKETSRRPSTSGSIESRREKVRDKKRRDMEALRNAKLKAQGGGSQDKSESEQTEQQSSDDQDNQPRARHSRKSSANMLCPIVVVLNVEPSMESPVDPYFFRRAPTTPAPKTPRRQASYVSLRNIEGTNQPTPPLSATGSPAQRQRITAKNRREYDAHAKEAGVRREAAPPTRPSIPNHVGGGVSHQRKESQTDKQIFRLYDAYRENRMRDVERRVRRLERNGDVWLRALVPVLDDMSRNIKAVRAKDRNTRESASDDEVTIGTERKGGNTEGRRAHTVRRASLSRGELLAGLVRKLEREDSEWSDSMSRSDDVTGMGSVEPLMRELAGEARRRQKEVEARHQTQLNGF